MMNYLVKPGGCLNGVISVPGDKSISHRSIMLGSLCDGVTQISGLLEGMDVLTTVHSFREMGVYMDGPDHGNLTIHGNGLHGLQSPKSAFDLGNSGTSMRLLTGLLCAQSFDSVLTGDESLSKRPMMRVIKPLSAIGANLQASANGTPPVQIHGGCKIKGGNLNLAVASAQVKSAILLAGLYADSPVTVMEPVLTRDHTERMLTGMGCNIESKSGKIVLIPPKSLQAKVINIPADISSAAFFIVGACISKGSYLKICNVGINPTRTGMLEILMLMGANIKIHNRREMAGEPIADIEVIPSELKGVEVPPHLVTSAIDEFPIIVIAAACAKGTTVVSGVNELRVKESDRIAAMVKGLNCLGIKADELSDGMIVEGGRIQGGEVDSFNDHRIAMSFAIAGLVSQGEIKIKDCRNVATSFPGFEQLAKQAGLKVQVVL